MAFERSKARDTTRATPRVPFHRAVPGNSVSKIGRAVEQQARHPGLLVLRES
jgi:methionine aminopeptidase